MEYFFVADFGSSNSGCAFMGNLYKEPYLLHQVKSTAYAKEETRFAIKEDFLNKLCTSFAQVKDSDFHIKSDTTRELYLEKSPNIVWRRDSLGEIEESDYVIFSEFKMELYRDSKEVLGSNGKKYSVINIIKIFLRLLKLDSYQAFKEVDGSSLTSNDTVHWGLTIPSIWSDENKRLMRSIGVEVFGDDTTLLSEPQGALTYFLNFADQGSSAYKDGRVTVIVDAGGGTTDIACILESKGEDGRFTFNSTSLPNGEGCAGNDIDKEFWLDLCDLLTQNSGTDEKYSASSDIFNDLIGKYISTSSSGRRNIINSWRKIQFERYERDASYLSFETTKDHINWLRQNGHIEIANYIREEDREIPIPKKTVDDCHKRIIIDKISPKIKSFVKETIMQHKHVDRIVLAGGLSYTTPFKQEIESIAREFHIQEVQLCSAGRNGDYRAVTKCSGAVVMGAVYQLAHPDILLNTAKQSVFAAVWTEESLLTEKLMQEFEKFKFASILYPSKSTDEQNKLLLRNIIQSKDKYDAYKTTEKSSDGKIYVRRLSPICVRGCIAKDFEKEMDPLKSNTDEIVVNIYSSENPFLVYCSDSIAELRKIETIKFTRLSTHKKITLQIKVSDAQNANPIVINLLDENKHIIKSVGIDSPLQKGL